MFSESDGFWRDPYGWLTNQLGHLALGVGLAWLVSVGVFLIFGELPYRIAAWALIVLGYLAFELTAQGWRGWDTIEDTIFVGFWGAGGALYLCRETTPMTSLVTFDLIEAAPFIAGLALHLRIGTRDRRPK